MNRTTIALVLGAALALTGHAQPSKDKGAQALRDLEAQWVKEFDAKDVAKMVAHYADDATLMGPGMPVATGKDAIRATIQEMVSDPNLSLHFQPQRVEIARSGEMGFTQGMYHMTMTDPKTKKPVTDKGKYLTIYAKQADGTWKAVADTFNSDSAM